MKEYRKYINNIESAFQSFENALRKEENITKLQPYMKALEKSKLELNRYINKQSKTTYKDDINYIIYNIYPHLVDKEYDGKILEHIILQQFYNPKSLINIQTKSKYKIFKLNAVQKMLRNFLGPNTPFNNMMLIHDPGVGKTCTAITISENLKQYVKMNAKRIYIIRPDSFKEQLFEMEKVKKNEPQMQCTGTSYLEEVKKANPINEDYLLECVRGDTDACDRLHKNIKKEIEKYYQFSNLIKWAKTINQEIEQQTSGLKTEKEKLSKKIDVIRLLFNNNLLIIDEAHKLRDESNTDGDERLVVRILNDVCLYSQNMKLLLLTATPMYDKPTEIIPLLNFMLLNDKRPILKVNDIFANDEGELIELGVEKLLYAIKGYVSYMRGNNPEEFPIRLYADVNLQESKMLSEYPTRDLTGAKIPRKDTIKYLKLVACKLGSKQQEVINNININEEGEEVRGVAYQSQLQAGNFIYQGLKESDGIAKECYGIKGLRNITKQKKGSYSFNKPEFAKELIGESLKNYSIKYYTLLQNIKKSNGPVFIYSNFIAGGILPLTFILELNGYKRYNGDTPFLNSKYKSSKILGEYVYFTGSERKSVSKYLNKRQNMINEPVRIFICSAVANEGLNLFGYRETHILDPWYNMSQLEQTIGRCIRRGSHLHLPEEERNVVVYLYANVFTGKLKDVESYDLRVYNIIEKKAINTGRIQNIIKENAIDCAILKKNNTRLKKDYPKKVDMITSHGKKLKVDLFDKPNTVVTFFQDKISNYCSTDKYKVKKIDLDTLLDFDLSLLDIEIREILEIIKIELEQNSILLMIDLVNIINNNIEIKYDKITIKKILEYIKEYYKQNSVKIVNKLGEISQIVYSSGAIRLLPLENINPKQSILEQYKIYNKVGRLNPIIKDTEDLRFKNINSVELIPLVNELKKSKDAYVKSTVFSYTNILSKIDTLFKDITNYNSKLTKQEAISLNIDNNNITLLNIIVDKLVIKERIYLIQNLVYRIINALSTLTKLELNIAECIKYNIIYNNEIITDGTNINYNKSIIDNAEHIYGFIVVNKMSLQLYKYDKTLNNKSGDIVKSFIIDKSKIIKIINERYSILKSQEISKIFSFLEYTKSEYLPPIFKIIDYEAKGFKKSVKGIACTSKLIENIKEYISRFNKDFTYKYKDKNKHRNCNNLELIMRTYTSTKLRDINQKILFMNPEQFWIWRSKQN
jgi:hypothetical protein